MQIDKRKRPPLLEYTFIVPVIITLNNLKNIKKLQKIIAKKK